MASGVDVRAPGWGGDVYRTCEHWLRKKVSVRGVVCASDDLIMTTIMTSSSS